MTLLRILPRLLVHSESTNSHVDRSTTDSHPHDLNSTGVVSIQGPTVKKSLSLKAVAKRRKDMDEYLKDLSYDRPLESESDEDIPDRRAAEKNKTAFGVEGWD